MKASTGPFALKIIGMGLAYAFTILLTRKYGASAFGLYALALVVMSITSMISRLGVDTAAVKMLPSFFKLKHEGKSIGFYIRGGALVLSLSILFSIFLYFSADFVSQNIFDKPKLGAYIQLFAIAVLPFSITQYHSEVLRGLGFPSLQVLFKSVLLPAVGVGVLGVAYFMDRMDLAISLIYVIAISVVCLISFGFIFWAMRSTKALTLSKESNESVSYREIFKLSLPMFFFASTMMMAEWVNTIMLGMLADEADVGVYRVIVRISTLNILVLTAINTVIAPRIAGLFAQGNTHALKDEVIKATKLIFWLSLPVQIFLFVFGGWLLGIFGKGFDTGLVPLYVVLVGQLVNSATGPVGQVLNMTNGQVFLSWMSILRVIFIIIMNLILIPLYGLLGVAISILASKFLMNLINVIKVKQLHGFYTFSGIFKI